MISLITESANLIPEKTLFLYLTQGLLPESSIFQPLTKILTAGTEHIGIIGIRARRTPYWIGPGGIRMVTRNMMNMKLGHHITQGGNIEFIGRKKLGHGLRQNTGFI